MPLFTFQCWILSPFYRQQIDILFNGHFKPLFDRAIPIVAIAGCIWNLRSTLPSYKYVVTVVMWTAVLTIGTPLGHGTTSPSTAAAAHSASDYICYCSAHWPVAPKFTKLVHRHRGAIRQNNEQFGDTVWPELKMAIKVKDIFETLFFPTWTCSCGYSQAPPRIITTPEPRRECEWVWCRNLISSWSAGDKSSRGHKSSAEY